MQRDKKKGSLSLGLELNQKSIYHGLCFDSQQTQRLKKSLHITTENFTGLDGEF